MHFTIQIPWFHMKNIKYNHCTSHRQAVWNLRQRPCCSGELEDAPVSAQPSDAELSKKMNPRQCNINGQHWPTKNSKPSCPSCLTTSSEDFVCRAVTNGLSWITLRSWKDLHGFATFFGTNFIRLHQNLRAARPTVSPPCWVNLWKWSVEPAVTCVPWGPS